MKVYGNVANVAVYNVPLKAGMEIEITHTFDAESGEYGNFLAIGVDKTNVIADLLVASGKYQTGLFNLYFDSPKTYTRVQTIEPEGSTLKKSTILSTGNNVSPRVVVIKRDAGGALSATVGGVAVAMPTYDHVATAGSEENLYAYIAGLDNASYFQITYFGALR